MLSLDDETCIEVGICGDLLPQYFEVAEGAVRVRAAQGEDRTQAGEDRPSASQRP
jgi:ferredoxin